MRSPSGAWSASSSPTSSASRRSPRAATPRRCASSRAATSTTVREIDRPLRRHGREVHRRRGHGRVGRADRLRGRRRAGRPRRARPRRRRSQPRPRHRDPGGDRSPARPRSPSAPRTRAWSRATWSTPRAGSRAWRRRRRCSSARRPSGRPRSAIVFEAAGEQVLKGKDSPVPGVAGGARRGRAWRGRSIGRRSRRRSSVATRSSGCSRTSSTPPAARAGRAWSASSGPAGIGKSPPGLGVPEVHRRAGRARLVARRPVSPAYGEGITFWALGEMIRGRAGLQETDDEPTTRAAHRGDARGARARRGRTGVDRAGAPARCSASRPADRLATSCSGPGAPSSSGSRATDPVVMVFEDLHHADPGLLDFIDHLLEWSRNVPILDRDPGPARADRAAARLGRRQAELHLDPPRAAADAAMRELLAGLVPGLPSGRSRRDRRPGRRHPAVRRRDGPDAPGAGPARAGRRGLSPVGDLSDLAVPETLTALIAARLDELDAADRAPRRRRRRPRTELHPGRRSRRSPDWTRRTSSRDSGRSSGASSSSSEVDPRSPERGQYAFVQALIREVAYNTLAKRDRKVRHLAAARYFESLGTDELAGALAGHYLAAQGYAADGPEADALAAQARVALRGLPPTGRPPWARTPRRSRSSSRRSRSARTRPIAPTSTSGRLASATTGPRRGGRATTCARCARGAARARRSRGDRHRRSRPMRSAIMAFNRRPSVVLEMLLTAVGGVFRPGSDAGRCRADAGHRRRYSVRRDERDDRLAGATAPRRASDSTCSSRRRAAWCGWAVPCSDPTAPRGADPPAWRARPGGRQRLRATSTGVPDPAHVLRTVADPAAGLAMARDGLEIATGAGRPRTASSMVGNGAVSAIRVGEWAWAAALLDE